MQAETGNDGRPTALAPMRRGHRVALAGVVGLSAFLNLFRLRQNGYGSAYYAAAVASMLKSLHNFFFVAFDPAGFVSVDKPPLGFWLQALSARLLGFHGTSLLLPQALLGVAVVFLLFHLVRRSFGVVAGLLAAAIMATTPIFVATSRSNHLDVALTLTMLLAAWTTMIAAEAGRLRWLLASAAIVGLGFNVKMLEAYLVVPALGCAYLVAAPVAPRRRLVHLGAAALVLAVVSVSWAVVVDRTPADRRPYVDSTNDDSELGLAFGYNGINRLLYAGAQAPRPDASKNPPQASNPSSLKEVGPRGASRLLTLPLGVQIGWWIPAAFLGALALGSRWGEGRGENPRPGPKEIALVIWGTWFITAFLVFVTATFIHAYYLVTLGPPTSALASAGFAALLCDHRDRPLRDARAWGLVATLALSAFLAMTLLHHYPGWSRWMSPCVLSMTAGSVAALLFARARRQRGLEVRSEVATIATGVGATAIVLSPLVWSLACLTYVANSDTPAGGPQKDTLSASLEEARRAGAAGVGGRFELPRSEERLLGYLLSHHDKETFLVGSLFSNRISAPMILASGMPVMSLGGFRGTTPILSEDKLSALIEAGRVRFFYLPLSIRHKRDGSEVLVPLEGKNVSLVRLIETRCDGVPPDGWDTGVEHIGGVPVRDRLFDCAGLKTASR
jgi:4-amino-4-deoxy-L-arabinose transferase-like glycosyltransferase